MRQIPGFPLWLGHVGDARDLVAIHAAGIVAVVDLALNEPPASLPRDLVYCRFPLVDGSENPRWLLRAAVEAVAGLLRSDVPTLVYCSACMSRTPAVAAAAIAAARGCPAEEGLALVTRSAPADVSPALWSEILAALA